MRFGCWATRVHWLRPLPRHASSLRASLNVASGCGRLEAGCAVFGAGSDRSAHGSRRTAVHVPALRAGA